MISFSLSLVYTGVEVDGDKMSPSTFRQKVDGDILSLLSPTTWTPVWTKIQASLDGLRHVRARGGTRREPSSAKRVAVDTAVCFLSSYFIYCKISPFLLSPGRSGG